MLKFKMKLARQSLYVFHIRIEESPGSAEQDAG